MASAARRVEKTINSLGAQLAVGAATGESSDSLSVGMAVAAVRLAAMYRIDRSIRKLSASGGDRQYCVRIRSIVRRH